METKKGPVTIDEYIATSPEAVRPLLAEIRRVIREAAPQAVEKISYQMPTYFWKKNLVHFAAFSKHIGFYPTPSGVEEFAEELKGYKTSKGAVQFPLDQPVPYDLIRRIVEFRVKTIAGG